jgi:RimJ/RimL family protein N-acetyltransferase
MSVVIERATPADASAVLTYLAQIGGETDNLSFGAEGLPFSFESEAAYLAQMQDSRDDIMLIAKEDGRIVGTCDLHRLPRRMSHRGEISVSVLRAYWNRGIGTQLMGHILDIARDNGFGVIDLQVRSDNAAAIRLYEKYGFEKIGTHPAFFEIDGETVSFDYMCLRLGQ